MPYLNVQTMLIKKKKEEKKKSWKVREKKLRLSLLALIVSFEAFISSTTVLWV